MAEIRIIETFGSITKFELLHTLESNILKNTFVLEILEPFPGYHGANLPSESAPHHIFLVTKRNYSSEEIWRVSQHIRQYFKHPFGARKAELHIFNTKLNSIRIKDLSSFTLIPELQSCYMSEGIEFRNKKTFNQGGLIKINKYFKLSEIEEGIFKDIANPNMYYLQIPFKLNWKHFETITYSIKNNLDNHNFDAALGVIYRQDLIDLVRIFETDSNLDRLKLLRERYLQEISIFHA
ncbi:MAG: hypothetical protein KAX05_07065 [Bacteroidales bacterium]|nr:hypothetical protein [Bacteroidales bacterium]